MNDEHIEQELKKEFQIERMILFSDAVFAIAITLMVLELKVPELPKQVVTDKLLIESLDHLIPKFIGFFISFIIIGLYWTVHHRMFGNVVNYTKRTLWLNLWFLFAVVLMPFSTAFYSEYVIRLLKTPVIVYVSNICFLGIMNFILWKHLTNPSLGLTVGLNKAEARSYATRAIVVPVVFIISAFVYFIQPLIAIYIPVLIPVVMRLIRGYYRKKYGAMPVFQKKGQAGKL